MAAAGMTVIDEAVELFRARFGIDWPHSRKYLRELWYEAKDAAGVGRKTKRLTKLEKARCLTELTDLMRSDCND